MEKEKEEFFYTISHDLKNPLNVVSGAIELLKDHIQSDKGLELHEMIDRNVERMDEMISNIIDNAKLKKRPSLNVDYQNLTDIVEQAVEFIKMAYGNQFEFDSDKNPICGYYDTYAIYRIIENLGQNALKYGARDKPITIHLKTIEDKQAEISVHNWGEPISKEKFDKIFNMFQKATESDEKKEGWGIGLATVYRLVRSHKGRVELDSDKQKGTTFKILLPYIK